MMKEDRNPTELFQELLQDILKSADNNLDAYVHGSLLQLGESPVKPEKMEKLFSLLPEIDEEYVLKAVREKKEYAECTRFFEWLYEYAKNIKKILFKAKPLCDMNIEKFEALAVFCIENVILHNKGVSAAAVEKEDDPVYSVDNISILCSIMDKYFESIFYKDHSRVVIHENIRKSTGLSDEKCNILWDCYLKQEQALWRKYYMQLQVNIDRRLNNLLDAILNMEEEE